MIRSLIREFKEFALRGSLLDLAIGLILGAAFSAIVNSFVNDVLMPPVGLLLGGTDFSSLFINLSGTPYPSIAAAKAAGAPTLNYGIFVSAVINFLIVAFVLFLVVRQVNRLMRRPEAQAAPATRECPYCASVIPIKATRCPQCTSDLRAA